MKTPIEQEVLAHADEAPAPTATATTDTSEAALLTSLETIISRLGDLEREALLMALQIDLETDRAGAERLTTLRPDDPAS